MKSKHEKYICSCGKTVSISNPSDIRCPFCGRIITIPSKEMEKPRKEEFEKFVDATFELLGEIPDNVCPFSGAR